MLPERLLVLILIDDGQRWVDMIGSRNKTSHTYKAETADEIFENIIFYYPPLFLIFQKVMDEKRSRAQLN
jgi:uncharacterized protein with HEPN domain